MDRCEATFQHTRLPNPVDHILLMQVRKSLQGPEPNETSQT